MQPSDSLPEPTEGLQLRPPSTVMRLERLGSFFPTRLSFLRSLLRKLATDGMQLSRPVFELDALGYGHVVYDVVLDGRHYSLIAYSQALAPEDRTDRVIAEAWDACFVLFDGQPNNADIAHFHDHATVQEAGHYDQRVLVLSRANKSVRLYDHVVERLAAGSQPDAELIGRIGYLMRTTAVYGNGKFGMADRADFLDRPSLSQPFRLEMLSVYLIREFTLDLVNHVASSRGGDKAVELARRFRRQLGIGNSTGLGMAPFLVGHPVLINNWMLARESALARVRVLPRASEDTRQKFVVLLGQAMAHLQEWRVDDAFENKRINYLRNEFRNLKEKFEVLSQLDNPWNRIVERAELGSVSLQELMVSLVLEPHGDLVDGLCDCMEDAVGTRLDPLMPVGVMQKLLRDHYGWALALDLTDPDQSALTWYVSEEKQEPRLSEGLGDIPGFQKMPHDIPRMVQALAAVLEEFQPGVLIAKVLLSHPQMRHIVRRVQTIAQHPYGEIRDNLVARDLRPIDLLRCKLSFFGASKFDPKSDRWTRITLFQGAPTAEDLTRDNTGDVFLPSFEN